MRSPIRLVRNVDAGRLLDTFLVSAVVTILTTRLYLHVTGYPQIGNSTLHIAHLLPGGLLMLAAILIMLASINRSARDVSALLGGVGFGLFWDELGKFITRDNNYFFRPTAALIYVTFVALYLMTRYVIRRSYHPQDYLANAIDLAMESAIGDLDPREYRLAKQLLAKADPAHPLYEPTRQLLEQARPTKASEPFLIDRLADLAYAPFRLLAEQQWFRSVLLASFYVYGIGLVGTAVWLGLTGNIDPFTDILTNSAGNPGTIAVAASILSALFVLRGIVFLHRRQTRLALQRFETAVLVNIFVTQPFLFLDYQFSAVIGLFIAICILFSVRVLLADERT